MKRGDWAGDTRGGKRWGRGHLGACQAHPGPSPKDTSPGTAGSCCLRPWAWLLANQQAGKSDGWDWWTPEWPGAPSMRPNDQKRAEGSRGLPAEQSPPTPTGQGGARKGQGRAAGSRWAGAPSPRGPQGPWNDPSHLTAHLLGHHPWVPVRSLAGAGRGQEPGARPASCRLSSAVPAPPHAAPYEGVTL